MYMVAQCVLVELVLLLIATPYVYCYKRNHCIIDLFHIRHVTSLSNCRDLHQDAMVSLC